MKLSVCVIARDEERDLPALLESLAPLRAALGAEFECVVLDSGSKDGTLSLAERWGARTSRRPFDDFATQKQACLDLAAGEWALSLDCDERLSPELAKDILGVLSDPRAAAGYELPFEVEFLGKVLRWGGLGGETHLRLFKRAQGRFGGEHVHEGVRMDGQVGRLPHPVRHRPYADLGEYMEKFDVYTERAARARLAAGRRPCWSDALRPPWELFSRLVLKLGVLDGTPGIEWARLSALHTRRKYELLAELAKAEPR